METPMLVRWTDSNSDRPFTLRPRVSFETDEDGFMMFADLPGVTTESLDVSVEQGVLTFSGSRTMPGKSATEVSYRRSIQLSEYVDAEAITATLADGVLQIGLPRAEQSRARKITVQAA
jgi:HSP20 family molecular chaperone IbpA